MIPVYKPYIAKYKTSAIAAIDSEWISNHGIYVDLASHRLKEILGVKHCILMNNGTSATHALIRAIKFKHPEVNKIYVPNNVFIAPINCALLEFDVSQMEIMRTDPTTLNICVDTEYIRSLAPNSAVLIVHNLGNIVNVPRLKAIRPDLIFVEDNCEGLFGKYNNIYSGTSPASLCSAISFYGNKSITTGEGGAFLTNDDKLYRYMKVYYSHGMSDVRYIHNVLGTNYRMTNVQAGLLYDQLNDIEHILSLKKEIVDRYVSRLDSLHRANKVKYLATEDATSPSGWMFCLLIPGVNYAQLENYLLEKQVQVRPFFYSLNHHAHLVDLPCHDSSEPAIAKYGVMLPSYPGLTADEQTYIVKCIEEFLLFV